MAQAESNQGNDPFSLKGRSRGNNKGVGFRVGDVAASQVREIAETESTAEKRVSLTEVAEKAIGFFYMEWGLRRNKRNGGDVKPALQNTSGTPPETSPNSYPGAAQPASPPEGEEKKGKASPAMPRMQAGK